MRIPIYKIPRPSLRSALALAAAFGAGAAAFGPSASWLPAAARPGPSLQELAAISAGYVCPMHPDVTSDRPGKCPICGMDLVKAAPHEHAHGVHVESAALANLGLRTVAVERREIGEEIRAFGTVVPDERFAVSITSKFGGWIRKLGVHAVGEPVRRGQLLYEIYSPELVQKEREYFQFLTRRKQILQSVGDVSQQENEYVMDLLRESQKEREELMRNDLDIETIQRLEQFGATIEVVGVRAPADGVVTQIAAREGAFVSPAAPVLALADPTRVWIDISLSVEQASRAQPGDRVTIRQQDADAVEARIDTVSPVLDGYRAQARAAVRQEALLLRLGAPVDVSIRSAAHAARVLPSSAVLRTGRGDFVMIARDSGAFLPAEVDAGIESGDWIEIRGGVQEGARVASNAQFLLDPGASLPDAMARARETRTAMAMSMDAAR